MVIAYSNWCYVELLYRCINRWRVCRVFYSCEIISPQPNVTWFLIVHHGDERKCWPCYLPCIKAQQFHGENVNSATSEECLYLSMYVCGQRYGHYGQVYVSAIINQSREIPSAIVNGVIYSAMNHTKSFNSSNMLETISNIVANTVPADDVATLVSETSVYAVMTNFGYHWCAGSTL